MNDQYLFMFLGYPGSGKTHFAKQLAKEMSIVRLNADATRVAAMGTIQKAREFNDETGLLNSIVFGVIDYATAQILESGNSVICDYQHNEKVFRARRRTLANEHGAKAVIIWLKTPRDVAVERGVARDELHDQRQHSLEKMEALVDKYIGLIEVPDSDEVVIEIDGTLPFEQQYKSFMLQLQAL